MPSKTPLLNEDRLCDEEQYPQQHRDAMSVMCRVDRAAADLREVGRPESGDEDQQQLAEPDRGMSIEPHFRSS